MHRGSGSAEFRGLCQFSFYCPKFPLCYPSTSPSEEGQEQAEAPAESQQKVHLSVSYSHYLHTALSHCSPRCFPAPPDLGGLHSGLEGAQKLLSFSAPSTNPTGNRHRASRISSPCPAPALLPRGSLSSSSSLDPPPLPLFWVFCDIQCCCTTAALLPASTWANFSFMTVKGSLKEATVFITVSRAIPSHQPLSTSILLLI